MTDWSLLAHAYGRAHDIPALLDRAGAAPGDPAWSELWSRLCHQGTVYTASYAALPALTDLARQWPAPQQFEPLLLAAAIVASSDFAAYQDPPDLWSAYPAQIEQLAALTTSALRHPDLAADSATYVYLLQALLAFEGVDVWAEHLDGINDEEYEVACPHCETDNFVAFGRHGHFATLDSMYIKSTGTHRTPLQPQQPANLDPLPRRLYERVQADGHPDVAAKITYVFGHAQCADCGRSFRVDQAITARWG